MTENANKSNQSDQKKLNKRSSKTSWLLFDELSPSLQRTIYYFSIPHWFDKTLAHSLLSALGKSERESDILFGSLINLPFVYMRDSISWQYTRNARNYIQKKFQREDPLAFKEVSNQIRIILENQMDDLRSSENQSSQDLEKKHQYRSWEIRQLQWQIAYHLAVLDPESSVKRLLEISEWAGSNLRYQNDQRLAIFVFRAREKTLENYRPEGVYLEGRYAYSREIYDQAEEKFNYVWHFSSEKNIIKIKAGHLLGVVLRKKGHLKATEMAEEILRESWRICRDTIGLISIEAVEMASRITNSLGATLVKSGDKGKVKEGFQILRYSLDLHNQLGDLHGIVQTLNTLGTGMLILGEEENFPEAEETLRYALSICKSHNYQRNVAVLNVSLANLLTEMGGESKLIEAEELLMESLDFALEHNNERDEALVLKRLGRLLLKREDANRYQETETYLRRSLDLWKKFSHRYNQREVLYLLATVLELTNREIEAEDLRDEANNIPM